MAQPTLMVQSTRCAFFCFALCATTLAIAQPQTQEPADPLTPTPAAANPAGQNKLTKATKVTLPLWTELRANQQSALMPLQGEWQKMSDVQKRKWLEVSKNYSKLSPDEQTKLHTRMTDWVRLSPDQRAQARLNFSAAKTFSAEEKQKQWEAYQALSDSEKAKLQAKAKASVPNSAALATKPQNKVLPARTASSPASPRAVRPSHVAPSPSASAPQ